VLNSTSDTFPTNYFLRNTIFYPAVTADVDPGSIGGTTPHLTNDFASSSGNPGQISSATGNSFWKGDDTAQFYQLVLNSTADVDATLNNKPALRIGDPAGAHMRLDGNEIQAITVVGASVAPSFLGLNMNGGNVTVGNGGTVTLGNSSRAFTTIRHGQATGNSNGSGLFTVTHSMTRAPDFILCTPTAAGTARTISPQAANRTSTTFTVEVRKVSDGTLLTSAQCDFDWVAIAL
jgi:hypothetical protein